MDQERKAQQLVDHLFRHEYGRMVAVLTRVFGINNLELAEDVVQDAFAMAVQKWKFDPIPENPSGWLVQVAKRKAIDVLRRNKRGKEITGALPNLNGHTEERVDEFFLEDEISDSQLRLIFACCHPNLKPDQQIAITLKTVSGFSVREIARALMISEDNVKQRLFRAREAISKKNIEFNIPLGADLGPRLYTVQKVLYLLFNEGYSSVSGDTVLRQDLCIEAMRLTKLLAEHKWGASSATDALLSLMCFQASRFKARLDMHDQIILLEDQDRGLWDRKLIEVGQLYLTRAMQEGQSTVFHIEAAIAAQHTLSKSHDETDWSVLRKLYEVLLEVQPSAIVKLNLVVVLLEQEDIQSSAHFISQLQKEATLDSNHLYHAVRARFFKTTGDMDNAKLSLLKAIDLTRTAAEKRLLRDRLADLVALEKGGGK